MDHLEISERLEAFVKAELPAAEAATVSGHLAGCASCRADLEIERRLLAGLEAQAVAVRADFANSVLSSIAKLPEASWQTSPVASARARWAWPLAAAALFALALGLVGAGSESPLAGTVGTLFDLAAHGVLAGAGLLGASWQGLGIAARGIFAADPMLLAGLGLGAGLGLFGLYRFLLRSRWARAAQRRDS